ncbi:hypothetical protein EG350_14215 [Chryseobacterium shandongense]|nr:hypothetical protein EG350_14215 [Chryseobacterium shandongense]
MRKKISWLFLLTVLLTLFSCRNDYFPEHGSRQYNNASQFQVVKFSDIPQVARFIKLKTGRNDLKIPIKSAHGFSAEAKANIDFANLETNFIIKKTENNRVFYISNISNAGDENTLYNFEAREAEGSIVDARIIEYSSEVPFGEKPLEVLSDFTGRVRMYDLQGKEKAGITFINGGETCDDNPTDPSSDSGGGGGRAVMMFPHLHLQARQTGLKTLSLFLEAEEIMAAAEVQEATEEITGVPAATAAAPVPIVVPGSFPIISTTGPATALPAAIL